MWAATISAPTCSPRPTKTSQGSRNRTPVMASRLPPRTKPVTTPATRRTRASSTGAGYRPTRAGRAHRAPGDKGYKGCRPANPAGVVPVVDGLLPEAPAQADPLALAPPREVDQA